MNDEIQSSKSTLTKRKVLRLNGALNTAKTFMLTLSLGFIATGASDVFLINQNNHVLTNVSIIIFGVLLFALSYGINFKLEVSKDD